MTKYYSDKHWAIGETYESLIWLSDEPPPTDEHLKELWQTFKPEYEVDQLRKIRNQKLSETDKYTIVDWPQSSEEKETRLKYRQQLRDLPQLYLEKMVGDYSISGEVLYVGNMSYNFFEPLEQVEPVSEPLESVVEPVEPIAEPVSEPVDPLSEPVEPVDPVVEPATEPTEPI